MLGRLAATGILIGPIALLGAMTALRAPDLLPAYPFGEDSFFYFTLARQMAHGRFFTDAAGEFVNGFQPLYPFLLWPLYALAGDGDPYTPLRWTYGLHALLAGVSAGLFGLTINRALDAWGAAPSRPRRAVWALGALWFLASWRIVEGMLNGMETGLVLVLLLLSALALLPHRQVSAEPWWMALLMGALVLARIDTVPFALTAAVLYAWRRRLPWQTVLGAGAAFVLTAGSWFALNLWKTGTPIPSSGLAYSAGAVRIDRWDNLRLALLTLTAGATPGRDNGTPMDRFNPFFPGDLLALLGLLGVLALFGWRFRRLWLRDRERATGLLPAIAASVVYVAALGCYYVLFFGAPWFISRYMVPVVLLVSLLECALLVAAVAPALASTHARQRQMAWLVACLGVALLGTSFARDLTERFIAPVPIVTYTEHYALASSLPPDARLGSLQSGVLSYFVPQTLNLDGKVNLAAVRAIRAGRLPDYARAAPFDYLVDWPILARERIGSALDEFTPVRSITVDGQTATLWERQTYASGRATPDRP